MPWWSVFSKNNGVGVAAFGLAAPNPTRSKENEPGGALKDWQRAAWGYYETLGEIHYAGGFYARMLSGVRLMIEEYGPPPPGADPDAPDEWSESDNAELIGVLERLENSRGGLAQLQSDYGRLRFVQGEAQLTRTLVDAEDAIGEAEYASDGSPFVEVWEMLSAEELAYNKNDRTYTRRRGGNSGTDEKLLETDPDDPMPGTMMAWRFYHRDPRHSGEADCSLRAVLDDCEELRLLKQAIRNMARNRGAGNGVFVMPAAMGGNEVDAGDGTKIPKNAKAIYESLVRPIRNEKDASAVTPVILFAPNGTTSSDVFHVDLRGAALYRETGLRDECIHRIAIGLDMPPEALQGVTEANHWTAWQVDDASWTVHGAPVTRELCGQLTAALLVPLALELNLDPRKVRIWFDATDVVMDPDRARAAADAFDRKAISYEAYRRETGWEESDAPDDQELADRRNADVKRASTGAPPGAQAEPVTQPASVGQVIGLADACYLRCHELAGSRLRSKVAGDVSKGKLGANLAVRMRGAPNHEVARRLGADIRGVVDPDALVAGAGQVFAEGMIRLGLEPGMSERLVRLVEEHAARTLFDEDPAGLPDEVLALCGLVSARI